MGIVNNKGRAMKFKDFEQAVQKTPVFAAVFTVVKVPDWADDEHLMVGEEMHYDSSKQCFARKDGTLIHLGASYVEFQGYKQII